MKIYVENEMENNLPLAYINNIQSRSLLHFLKGLILRYLQWKRQEKARKIARKRGAKIGENTVLPLSLAKRANSNLIVGHNTCIHSDDIDLRSPVKIGNNCIIAGFCKIYTTSHIVDSLDFEHKFYGIEIDDYVWITGFCLIAPACRHIGYGAVCAMGSVVVKDVESMSIVGGNPAKHLRFREKVHKELVVESMLGGDFKAYLQAWKNKNSYKL